jgi:hypothetical protein
MILGALIQHWLCYRRYPESRCITLFKSPEQVAAPHEIDAASTSIDGEAAQTQGNKQMTMVDCGRCGMKACDNDAQSVLATLKVEDETCAYFIEPKAYAHRCQFVRDSSRSGSVPPADKTCPYMRERIASRPDWRLGVSAT